MLPVISLRIVAEDLFSTLPKPTSVLVSVTAPVLPATLVTASVKLMTPVVLLYDSEPVALTADRAPAVVM